MRNLKEKPFCIDQLCVNDYIHSRRVSFEVSQSHLERRASLSLNPAFSTTNSLCMSEKQPPEDFCKKVVLKKFSKCTGKQLCRSLFFTKATLLKVGTPKQVISCEYCDIFKNSFFGEDLLATVSWFWERTV